MNRRDAIVLGGGPAGAAVATLAARAGLRVLLLERERFPRDKVCGEFVSAEGCAVLRRIGALPRLLRAGAGWIETFRMTDPHGREIRAVLPDLGAGDRRALGVSRAVLDATLLDLAREAGTEVVEQAVASRLDFVDGRVAAVRWRLAGERGAEHAARAAVVVAADGRKSLLVRTLHPDLGDPIRAAHHTWYGLAAHLPGRAARLEGAVELHLFDGGYLGLSHVEGDRVNLALVVTRRALRACGGSPDRLLSERLAANPAVAEVLAGRSPSEGWRSVGPLRFGLRLPTARGALAIGDAAGTVDPLSGEGMANALLAAEIALPAIEAAAARGSLPEEAATAYDRAWRARFEPVTRRVRRLGRLLERPRIAAAGFALLSAAPRPVVDAIVRSTRTGIRPGERSGA